MRLFLILVIVESGITLARTGSLVLPAIGLIAYFSPLPAILLGYNYVRTRQDAANFLKLYVVLTLVMISGIYLSLAGYDWKILSQVGEGLYAFAPTGEQLNLLSGFFRAPEVAAWHAATSICALILLFMVIKGQKSIKWVASMMLPFLVVALVFTGRRKFVVEIALFAVLYVSLLTVFQTSAIKSVLVLVAGIFLTVGAYTYLIPPEATDRAAPYYGRTTTVQGEGSSRLMEFTVEAFEYVVAQNGVFGVGAGMGSQGSQYYGGGGTVVGGNAEGGVGKVLAELGVPGFLLLSWLAIGLARYSWSIVAFTRGKDPLISRLAFGLISLAVVNVFVFAAGGQAFGDPFILIVLGFMLGFLFAVPKMLGAGNEARQRLGRPRTWERARLVTNLGTE